MARPWVVITGASSGIGASFCGVYAEKGYNLVMVARREEMMQERADELRTQFSGLSSVVLGIDLSTPSGGRAVSDALKNVGIVAKALVNNAGEPVRGKVAEVPWEHQQRLLQLMVGSPTYLCHWFLGQCGSQAHILNVSSIGALLPTPKMAIYGPTKAYLVHLSETIAAEAPECVVVVVLPGYVRTGVHAKTGFGHLERKLPGFMWMESEAVAREAVQVVEKGRSCIYIPGLVNRVTAYFFKLPLTRRTWEWMTSPRTANVSWSEWAFSMFVSPLASRSKL